MEQSSATFVEALAASLERAAAHNPDDADQPVAVLWSDPDSQWRPIISPLRRLLPQLLELGDYDPDHLRGPSIWLRCAIEGTLAPPVVPAETIPIVYLPSVGRQELGTAEACPDELKPLIELQYRGTCWTQKNGKDWTVEAFLVSKNGGLGLDVSRDDATRRAMQRAVGELATAHLRALKGRRLEAEDFDRLFSDDLTRDVLVWMGDAKAVSAGWDPARQRAFVERCKADLDFDPEKDGEFAAGELLGRQEGAWEPVWRRFAESPAIYPKIPELLHKAMPDNLFAEPRSSWPQNNAQDEADLRKGLLALENLAPALARAKVTELEKEHGHRRDWVWAKLGKAPLAQALEHLMALADRTSKELGGASVAEMADLYADRAWQADSAALASMAAVKSSADMRAIRGALRAMYGPWLESAALHFQKLTDSDRLPIQERHIQDTVPAGEGVAILFADGLRFDVAHRLEERLRLAGRSVDMSKAWAGLPTVTATAKPAVSPVADRIDGDSLGENFLPVEAETGSPLTTDRFRRLLGNAGYQYLHAADTGDPSGRAWTEHGKLDKLGHSEQGRLASRIDEQIALLLERIKSLLDAGWTGIRVVTDHGWLWLPGGLPKTDLPKWLTKSRWARCACIEQGSTADVTTVPWRWNASERVAVAPGISCFSKGNEYAHGGLSLQESLIPILDVTAGTDLTTARPHVADVSWIGLRCRVRIDAAQSGLLVDLRTRVNDADSSASGGGRPVDEQGAASLLVADDDLEKRSAAVVVLDTAGQVLAMRATIIGGDE